MEPSRSAIPTDGASSSHPGSTAAHPDPVDRPAAPNAPTPPWSTNRRLGIDWFDGDRDVLRALFEEAEDSPAQLDAYLDDGRVLVARLADQLVGHLQLVDTEGAGEIELKNMAVVGSRPGDRSRTSSWSSMLSPPREPGDMRGWSWRPPRPTSAICRFYQRCGFRFSRVEHDAFVPETGYADGLRIEGIPLRDRVWFVQQL